MIDYCGFRCYPTDNSRFGSILIGEYAKHHGEGDPQNCTVFTLQDVWTMLSPAFDQIRDLKWVCWTPVDHDPAPPMVVRFLKEANARVIAMSRHGQAAFQDQDIDALYVPHGVDTTIFKPERDRRSYYREQLKIPKDAFVVGMVANNQGLPSRKAFPQVFEAFAEFAKRHDDAILYCHADVYGRNNGVNLIQLADAYGIEPERLRASDQLLMHLGLPQSMVAGVFNSLDVLCMPSLGEGFGIPLIEAQACGVPVITTDWTAMSELVGPGWLVDGSKWWDQTQGAFQKVPFVGEILEALEESYGKAEGLSGAAVEFAAGYDVDRVMVDHFVPVLDEVLRPREVAPLELVAA